MSRERRKYHPCTKYENRVAPGRCQASVSNGGMSARFHQCNRRAVVDGEWCKQHSPEAIAQRDKESMRRYKESVENSPLARAQRRADVAEARVLALESQIRALRARQGGPLA